MSEIFYKCPLCEKMCKGIDGLKIHMQVCVKKDPNKIIALECGRCNVFMLKSTLINYMIESEKFLPRIFILLC